MNQNDADRIRTVLQSLNMQEAENQETADVIVFVTCSIRQHAEDRVFGLLQRCSQQRKKKPLLALTGCMVQKTSTQHSEKRDRLLTRSKRIDFVFRIEDAGKLPELLREFTALPEEFSGEFPGIFEVLPTQKKKHSAFVPISTGCDHHCTYCIVPHTRGKEVCRPQEDILRECELLVKQGAKEITLLGQNVNRYYFGERGKNPYKTDFAQLLERVADIPGIEWLRFLSPHPQHLGQDVLEVMASRKNICKHLHLPVQSGDNEMLQRMARGYTVEKFRETVQTAREMMPTLSVTTDIIVGFCGETKEQFQNSAELCVQEQFDMIYIAKFSPRPHTPAQKWQDDVSAEEKKRRFHILNNILRESSFMRNTSNVGKTDTVLVDAVEQNEQGEWIARGRNEQSKSIFVPVGSRGKAFEGQFVSVTITGAEPFFLTGELVIAEKYAESSSQKIPVQHQ